MLVGLFVLVLLLAGCGTPDGALEQDEQGQGGANRPEGVGREGASGEPLPNLAGHWMGTAGPKEAEFRIAYDLEQGENGVLSGEGTVTFGDGTTANLENLEGRVEGPGETTITYREQVEGEETIFRFQGALEDDSITEISGEYTVSMDDGEERLETYPAALERANVSHPRSMAVAAVQATHDRNFSFLAEHGHPDWEEFVQSGYPNDFEAPTFAGAIEKQFEYESTGSEYTPPPPGVTVELDTANVLEEQQEEGGYYIEFVYTVAGGEEINAEVALQTMGVDEETSWRVYGIELEYEYADYNTLALGPS